MVLGEAGSKIKDSLQGVIRGTGDVAEAPFKKKEGGLIEPGDPQDDGRSAGQQEENGDQDGSEDRKPVHGVHG